MFFFCKFWFHHPLLFLTLPSDPFWSQSQTKTAPTSISGFWKKGSDIKHSETEVPSSQLLSTWLIASVCCFKENYKKTERQRASLPFICQSARLHDFSASLSPNVKVGNTTSDRKTFPISALGWESLAQILFQRGDGLTRGMTSDGQTLRMIFAPSFDFQFPAEYPFALTARSTAIRATVGSIDVFVQSSWWSQQ